MNTTRRSGGCGILPAGLWAAACVLLLAVPAAATPEAAAKIPPNDFGCTACHAGTGSTFDVVPIGTAAILTPFGDEWLRLAVEENERFWADMAAGNADNDGCSNGCELDDPRGTYLPDEPFEPEACAPGNPSEDDCALPINERSWSTLKSLFGEPR